MGGVFKCCGGSGRRSMSSTYKKDEKPKELFPVWPSVNGEGLNQEMQDHAVMLAKDGLQMCKDECELAAYMKKGFDSKFHPTWQAVVGRTFGSDVGHGDGDCLFFYLGPGSLFPEHWKEYPGLAVLIFKTVGASRPYLNEEDREFCRSVSQAIP